jgi:hypothetical protein
MFEAKHVTTIRPSQRAKTSSRCRPTPVAEEREQALGAELRETAEVRRDAVDGRLVEAVVAGEEDPAQVGLDRHARGVGDRVGHVDELDLEGPEVDRLGALDVGEVGLLEAVLVELRARHGHRQRPAEDRDVDGQLAQDPGQRAEVVLVAVRDDDALDVVDAVAQVVEVGQDEVHAHLLGRREPQARVHQHDAVLVLDDRHVLADLPQAAEGEDAQRAAHAAQASARR